MNQLPTFIEREEELRAEGFPFSAPRGYIIIQTTRGETLSSGLKVSYRQDYPHSGWVVSSGARDEDIREGDHVILEVDSWDIAPAYYKVFELLLDSDGETISVLCDPEVEPVIVEQVEKYRATKDNSRITVAALDGWGWQFEASDVLTYQWAEGNSPAFSLLYPANVQIFRWKGLLFYKVHERYILAVMRED